MTASIHQFTVNCLFENYGSEELRCSTWSNIGVRFRIALNMSVSRAKQVGSQPQKRQAWTLWRYCVGDCGRPPKILILACHHSIPLVLDGPRVPRYLLNFPLVKKKHWYFVGILSVKGHFHSVPSDGFFYFLCTSDPGPSHSSYIWPGPRYSSHRATCRSTNPHNKNYIGLEIKYKRYEQFNTVFSRLGLPK